MTLIAEQSVLARAVSPLKLAKSPEKGTPCATVACKLKDGPNAGETIDYVGWLSEKAKIRTVEALGLFGFDGENPASVQKNEVRLDIRHETYTDAEGNEHTRARVAFVNDPTNRSFARFDVLEPAQEAVLLEDIRGLLLAKKSASSGTDFDFGANAKPDEGKVVF